MPSVLKKRFKHYEQERNIEVHRTDDCQYRNSNCNGPRRHIMHGRLNKNEESLSFSQSRGILLYIKLFITEREWRRHPV